MADRTPAAAGLLNLRDVGGCPTADGRAVAPGLVFRSAEPVGLSPGEVGMLWDHLGVRTVIDLRGPDERSRRPCAEIETCGMTVHQVPMVAASSTGTIPVIQSFEDVGDFYATMATQRAAEFVQVMTLLAMDALPALIHCAAGKDRTGVTIALLLDLLGVPDDRIVADYVATQPAMAAILDRIGSRAVGVKTDDIPDALLHAPAEAMERFLEVLRTDHGSAANFLVGAGLAPDGPGMLRARLLQ
ncbi:MAG: tyrosine-protein phosphatase [Acidimicrobiales bacterium]